jgi:hypothetical protein
MFLINLETYDRHLHSNPNRSTLGSSGLLKDTYSTSDKTKYQVYGSPTTTSTSSSHFYGSGTHSAEKDRPRFR